MSGHLLLSSHHFHHPSVHQSFTPTHQFHSPSHRRPQNCLHRPGTGPATNLCANSGFLVILSLFFLFVLLFGRLRWLPVSFTAHSTLYRVDHNYVCSPYLGHTFRPTCNCRCQTATDLCAYGVTLKSRFRDHSRSLEMVPLNKAVKMWEMLARQDKHLTS